MKRNWHQEAIAVLHSAIKRNEIMDIVFEIAQSDPQAMVLAHEALHPKPVERTYDESDNWKVGARLLIADDEEGRGLVNAIKHCRSITGWGLKQSLDAVKQLSEDVGNGK